MNYPVWQIGLTGGGLLIALMAVVHVYISHFAIGGGLFLVLTEMKGYRDNSPAILEYTRKHTRFFLLVTMVLGALTGVGIWFTISLLNPAATSTLIHNFVFIWGTEWVFFLAEIVSIFVYYYTFGRMERRKHLLIGWLYFIFAWLSLFAINGIIAFMLTPGQWPATGNIWDAFFNQTFWPSLFLRTFLALMLAGLYGFLTATAVKDRELRETLVRYCSLWLLAPFFFFLASAYWYSRALPSQVYEMIFSRSPEFVPYFKVFIRGSIVLFLGGLLLAAKLSRLPQILLAATLFVIGLSYIGSFEFVREGARRPYIIYGHTYSNSITQQDYERVKQQGVLRTAKWAKYKKINDKNKLTAGRDLYNLLCLSCHSIRGPLKDIMPLTADYPVAGLAAKIEGLSFTSAYMPPFPGTDEEREALAAFIVNGLHNKEPEVKSAVMLSRQSVEIPPFDEKNDKYVLLAWNSTGMHAMSDADRYFSLQPPGNDLYAQLIRRGETPETVTKGVSLTYEVQKGFDNPAAQVEFWDYTSSLLGKSLEENIGLKGNGLSGTMSFQEGQGAFLAAGVPVVPYAADGSYMPYPLFIVTAHDAKTGKVLATARIAAPVSTEMGCRNCHGGPWRTDSGAGFTPQTARNILAVHDRMSKTDLLKMAEAGKPVLCQSCHADQALNKAGRPGLLNLSAAIHGFHANVLKNRGAEACFNCHPADPKGATRFLRGIHNDVGFDCTNCHGTLEDHALSLVLAEEKAGKQGAARLRQHLAPRMVAGVAEIKPRKPWIQEPDCLTCHEDFGVPANDVAFNTWTAGGEGLFRNRTDDLGVKCAACHGSPHAVYPATNPYGKDRDDTVPIQYQGNPYPMGANKNCRVCHTINMEDEMHHPNSLRMFRNVRE